jgi:hypothetical protein
LAEDAASTLLLVGMGATVIALLPYRISGALKMRAEGTNVGSDAEARLSAPDNLNSITQHRTTSHAQVEVSTSAEKGPSQYGLSSAEIVPSQDDPPTEITEKTTQPKTSELSPAPSTTTELPLRTRDNAVYLLPRLFPPLLVTLGGIVTATIQFFRLGDPKCRKLVDWNSVIYTMGYIIAIFMLSVVAMASLCGIWFARRPKLSNICFRISSACWFISLLAMIIIVENLARNGMDIEVDGAITHIDLNTNMWTLGQIIPLVLMIQPLLDLFSNELESRGRLNKRIRQSLQSQVDSLAKDKKLLEQQKQSLLDSSANDKKSFEKQKQSLQSQVKSFQDAIDSENAHRASRTFDSRDDTMVRILKCSLSKCRTQPNLRELSN